MKKKQKKLEALYSQIPSVEGCEPDCGGCCGPVPMVAAESVKMGLASGMLITPIKMTLTHDLTCRFYEPMKGCTNYDNRPLMCRLFGATAEPSLRCPKGASATTLLTLDETRSIMKRYKAFS